MTSVTWTCWQDLGSDTISGGLAKRSSLWVPMIGFLRFFIMTHSTTHQSLWVRMNSKSKHVHIHQASVFVSWTLENSSWVLSQPCWVLIQREWLVHLARPVLSSFCQSPRRVFGSHWQHLFSLMDSFSSGKRKCVCVACGCSAEL